MITSPKFSFIQFNNPDDCCCGVVLPALTVSDISFYIYTDFRFKIGVKSEKKGTITLDSFVYQDFGDWIDLAINDKDLSDIFQCNECFRIIITDENNTLLAESNLLQYICDTSYTSVIKYYLNEAGFGWDCPTGWNSIRLPIYLTNPQFPQEQEIYKRRDGSRKILFAEISKEYALLVDYLPENIHQKLIVALSHDEVFINDKLLTKSEDYSINWDSVLSDHCGRHAPASCSMVENVTALNSNCGDCNNANKYCTAEWVDFICQTTIGGEFIPIKTLEDFFNIGTEADLNPNNYPYVLMNDLDFSGVDIQQGISQENGKLYGQGYALKNIDFKSKTLSYFITMQSVIDCMFDTVKFSDEDNNSKLGAIVVADCYNSKFINFDLSRTMGKNSSIIVIGNTIVMCSFENISYKITNNDPSTSGPNTLIRRKSNSKSYLCNCIFSTINYKLYSKYTPISTIACSNHDNIINCIVNGFTIDFTTSSVVGLYETSFLSVIESTIKNQASKKNNIVINSQFLPIKNINNSGVIVHKFTNTVTLLNNYRYNSFLKPNQFDATDSIDGAVISKEQAMSQAFYESLDFDFDGSTQEDGKAVWEMNTKGYPVIIRPYKKFGEPKNTGNALAQKLIYKLYKGEHIIVEISKSILTDVEPQLTSDNYSQLTDELVAKRGNKLLETIKKCLDFKIINNLISEQDNTCKEKKEDEFMIGQIIDFAGQNDKWDTTKWLLCDGKKLAIADYPELFDIIGTLYGGDGVTTFNLPSHNGRASIGTGQATDLITGDLNPNYTIAEKGGENKHKLVTEEMPMHSHKPGQGVYKGNRTGDSTGGKANYAVEPVSGQLIPDLRFTTDVGGDQYHENRSPFIVIHKLIRYKQ